MTRSELKRRARAQLGDNLFGGEWLMALLVLLIEGAIVSAVSSFTMGIGALIVTGPLTIGVAKALMQQARTSKITIEDMFTGFTSNFGNNLVLVILIYIFTFLWSLLFVIPGIVKAYSYSMAIYIRNDHPELDWKETIDASRKMTDGHKMELFLLDLSFIGWYIVGSLCFGVGILWVVPYHEATRVQFYEALKAEPAVA